MPEPSGLRPENYQFATLAQRKLLLSGGSQFPDRPCTLPANRRSPRAQHTRGRSLDLFVLPVGTDRSPSKAPARASLVPVIAPLHIELVGFGIVGSALI